MIITFDVPDTTRAAFLNFVFGPEEDKQLGVAVADSDKIMRGETIKFQLRRYSHEDTGRSD